MPSVVATSKVWWYVARSSGLVSWGLLTMTVVWGLLLSTKLLGRSPTPAWILDLHRFVGAGTVVFTAVHVGAIMADSYAHFGITDVLVPFASSWDPAAVAWGVVALYLLVAVEVTSLLRRRLPKALWRRVHYLSLPLFMLATVHGFAAGTDVRTTVSVMTALVAASAIGFLVAVRLVNNGSPPRRNRQISSSPTVGRSEERVWERVSSTASPSSPAEPVASGRHSAGRLATRG